MMVEQYRSDVYKIDKNGGGFSNFIAVLQLKVKQLEEIEYESNLTKNSTQK